MGAIWSGGGTFVAWSSLVAVAGIVGVPVLDLARKNFIPVIIGMIISVIVAVLFLM
jgi:O-antigen ligase